MTPREEFTQGLALMLAFEANVDEILALIQALIAVAISENDMCCPLDQHWRAADTGELFTGARDDVGECEPGCPVHALESVGLVAVQMWQRCRLGHDWYGDGCPECSDVDDEGNEC